MSTRSPALTEDELALALYAYLQIDGDSFSPDPPPVRWLGQVLWQLPIYGPEDRRQGSSEEEGPTILRSLPGPPRRRFEPRSCAAPTG